MNAIGSFADAAKGLARNPLGIIALFIVLIYGFAALTLSMTASLSTIERLPLVWFLVIFPVVVLFVFGWLVSNHHEKLYAPADYKTDDGFFQGIQARNRHAAEIQAQQDVLKTKIKEVVTSSSNDKFLVEELTRKVDEAMSMTIDARNFLGDPSALFTFPVAAFETFGELTDAVYFKLMPNVKPYEYGFSWVLRREGDTQIIRTMRMLTGTRPGRPLPDLRTLNEVGIEPGSHLIVGAP